MPNPPIILPPAPKVLRVRLIGTSQTRPWVNVLHVRYTTGSPSTADCNTYASNISSYWNSSIAPVVTTQTQLNSVEVLDLDTDHGNIYVNNTVRTGTKVGSSYAPTNTACCVSWKILRRYRGGHPRTYVAGVLFSDMVNGTTWSGTYVTAMSAAWNAFLTSVNSMTGTNSPFFLCNVSYYKAHQGYPNDVRPVPQLDDIQSATVHTRIDSMRRRTGKETS